MLFRSLGCPGPAEASLSPSRRTHQRSKSDATATVSLGGSLRRTGSNPKVETGHDEVSAVCVCVCARAHVRNCDFQYDSERDCLTG